MEGSLSLLNFVDQNGLAKVAGIAFLPLFYFIF